MPESSDEIRRADEITLADLIRSARERVVVRVLDGEDVFEMRFLDDRLPDEARTFLIQRGRL